MVMLKERIMNNDISLNNEIYLQLLLVVPAVGLLGFCGVSQCNCSGEESAHTQLCTDRSTCV